MPGVETMAQKIFIAISAIAAFINFPAGLPYTKAMASDADPYVVKNIEIPPEHIIATKNLVYKPYFDKNLVLTIDESKKMYGIRWNYIQGVIRNDKNVIDYAKERNINIEQIDSNTVLNLMKINAEKKAEDYLKWYIAESQSNQSSGLKKSDTYIIYHVLNNVNPSDASVSFAKHADQKNTKTDASEYLIVKGVGPSAINTYTESMARIIETGNSDPAMIFRISDAEKNLKGKYDLISKTDTNAKRNEVSFGRPFAFTAKERKLLVPPSIEKKMSVYWIEFAITPRLQNGREISSLNFSVDMMLDDSIALELVPLEYGKKVNEKVESGSPEITIEAGGGKLTIGEFFKRTIEYEYIKPTVKALGLREQQFGWLLENEMATTGAKRFICIIGVPKLTKKLDVRLAVTTERKNFMGYIQPEIGTTEPVKYTIDLP